MLSRLGFVASELLLAEEGNRSSEPSDERAVILFNRSSSIHNDKLYLESIAGDEYFPSPSLFVYTLPNIVTGEIAIRNHYYGETSFYVFSSRNDELMRQIVEVSVADDTMGSVLCGWLDFEDDEQYIADLFIMQKPS